LAEIRARAGFTAAARKGGGKGARERGGNGLWDRPALLNLISDVLILFGTTALGYACFSWFLRQPLFPIDEVVVSTPVAQVTAAQLEYAARTAVKGGFFTVDLDQVRQTFEKLPWVRKAEVRRHWPSSLEVRLEEHVAAAFWTVNGSGETRLVNRQGEVFIAASNAHMPSLAGPEGSAPLLLARYRSFGEAVAPLGHELVALTLSAREAWQLRLDNGLVIQLGREQASVPIGERLARFVKAYPVALEKTGIQVAVADLRYPGGFALKAETVQKSVKGK